MKCELMSVADYAEDSGGKMTLVGVFSTIQANEVPLVVPSMTFAVRLRIDEEDREKDTLALELRVLAPNNDQVASIRAAVGLKDKPHADRAQFVASAYRLRLPLEGTYRIQLLVAGSHFHEISFRVVVKKGLQQIRTR